MPEFGRHCAEIMEGRHPDVLEMDAASNTGVDNMREIIESARYKPLMARYKVYLIDEVHMLSKGAFNALLKTLEEPPGHVKFIFATTEVRKVPVTVLSRTQRFDLRRVDVPVLVEHFKKIVANEGGERRGRRAGADRTRRGGLRARRAVPARPGAGDGRRAASHGARVRAMLGLADRGRIFDLLEKLMGARRARRWTRSRACTATAPSPARCWPIWPRPCTSTTRAKTLGARGGRRRPFGARKSAAPARSAERLSVAILARAWQMLLKGLEEVAAAPNRGRGGRNGADPPRLHGRPAGAGRDHQGARAATPAARRRSRAPAAPPGGGRPRTVARRCRASRRRGRASRATRAMSPRLAATAARAAARCARLPTSCAWRARAARPSSRCTWKST